MATVIVDYGMANLRSVQKAFEQVGHNATISGDPKHVATASRVVLPGVGAFRDAIARLRETGLDEAVRRHIDAGRPFLGICLGMQLLFSRSHEDGVHAGLNVFQGDVVKFPPSPALKVPHMGWNTLKLVRPDCPLFQGLPADPAVYFVHSYFAAPAAGEIVVATADYPAPFCSVVWKGNVYATQFHPEKSQRIGVQMLRNFSSL
ncbi:Imidazole glycerol phosphate synthase subunit HisH 1 [Gemmata obscuriglobus]|uniref:Imidazole glycerol phosphate synthase subunit HisH n=1 Tax=Gemmata obscuriglobus TaxID=114 RepID=A0A2Z3GX75_9BACT